MEDVKIIDLFFGRSEQAIAALSEKYGDLCHKVSYNILRDELDAEECVNDAYLGVWNTIPPQNPNPLITYLCRIVRNLSVKRYHYNTAQKRNSYYDAALEELENCIPAATTVEAELEAKELALILDEFLDTLDQENRVMFMRRYWFSESVSDIASLFSMNSHTVTVKLSRIRDKLRNYLTERGVYI